MTINFSFLVNIQNYNMKLVLLTNNHLNIDKQFVSLKTLEEHRVVVINWLVFEEVNKTKVYKWVSMVFSFSKKLWDYSLYIIYTVYF